MCGIIGYKGEKRASEVLLNGIKNLDYRGYDSVGIATLFNNELNVKKDKGRADEVNEKINFLDLKGSIGIAHTRWSTHGIPNKANAHPHLSSDSSIAVVHNGIIENYSLLKEKLINEGYKFNSETDSEVIPILIEKYIKKYNFEEAVKKTIRKLEGSFAILVLSKKSNKIIAAKKNSPLVLGIGNNEYFIASDVLSFIEHTKRVIFIEDNEMVVIDTDFKIINFKNGKIINREAKRIEFEVNEHKKGDFEHFMLKEIFEQPRVIENIIKNKVINNKVFFKLKLTENFFKNLRRIVLVACGTAWHSCLIGKYVIEELARIPVEVDYASEFRYRNPIIDSNDLIIAVSQSGETADTIAAVKEAKSKGAKILSICNVIGSGLTRESDEVIFTDAGLEIGVASTKAFTAQITILYLLGIYLSRIKNSSKEKGLIKEIEYLKKIPLQIEFLIREKDKISQCAEKYFMKSNSLFLGRGINFPIALEGALKLKEVSYIHAEGYPAAEIKHGPIALIDNEMPVIIIAIKDASYPKIMNNIREIKSRGGIVIAIATQGDNEIKELSEDVIYVPETSSLLYPLLTNIPLQLLAYFIAKKRGCDIDKPRNLAKSVTVE